MSALRFAILTTFFPPYSFGGDAVGVRGIAECLAKRGHEVTVIHDRNAYGLVAANANPPSCPPPAGVRIVALESRFHKLALLLAHQLGKPVTHAARLKEILQPNAFDIIWFHNISLLGGPKLLEMGDGLKMYEAHEHWLVCPTHVLWRHQREPCTKRECLRCVLRHRRPPQLWRYTGKLPRMLRHIDLFIAKSSFSRDKHSEFGFPYEMTVVPHFLPDRSGNGGSAGSGSRLHKNPYFLFVGRLDRIKGLDDIIPVFARRPEADLLIAGSGPHEPALRSLAASGIGNVHFLGHVEAHRLTAYYRYAIALVVPSVCYETFGLVTIEALREGTPIVVRNLGSLPEIAGQSGAGVVFNDTEELPAVLTRLQRDIAYRRELKHAARKSFRLYWSEQAVMQRYFQHMAEAAERGGRKRLASALETAG